MRRQKDELHLKLMQERRKRLGTDGLKEYPLIVPKTGPFKDIPSTIAIPENPGNK
jgi:hypothetical protein